MKLSSDRYIIDFEGYQYDNKFIFKEICFYNIDTKNFVNFFIKTNSNKIKFDKTYYFLLNYFHFIPYYFGNTKFYFIRNNYFNNNKCIFYVNGIEKLKILQRYTKCPILNLKEFTPVILNDESPINIECKFRKHFKNKHCAINKVKCLVKTLHYKD